MVKIQWERVEAMFMGVWQREGRGIHVCGRERERERERSEIANKSVQVLASASLTGIKYLSNHSVSVTEKQPV